MACTVNELFPNHCSVSQPGPEYTVLFAATASLAALEEREVDHQPCMCVCETELVYT